MRGAIARVERVMCCIVGIGLLVSFARRARPVNHCRCTLTEQDRTAIRSTIEKYRTSWLADNAGGVMATFTDDSVLMPAQGSTPAVGREAIRKYWWPASGPKTTITKLNITYEEIGGRLR
jgi:hypothetical protein